MEPNTPGNLRGKCGCPAGNKISLREAAQVSGEELEEFGGEDGWGPCLQTAQKQDLLCAGELAEESHQREFTVLPMNTSPRLHHAAWSTARRQRIYLVCFKHVGGLHAACSVLKKREESIDTETMGILDANIQRNRGYQRYLRRL
jgi:hypothetical protein